MGYCQLCGKFIKTQKGKPLCFDCWSKKNKFNKEKNGAEEKGSKHFIYILRIRSKNKYYIGYSNNIRRRLFEHREGDVQETKNLEPELMYFEIMNNKEQALHREKELKNLNEYAITEIIISFRDIIKELGGL